MKGTSERLKHLEAKVERQAGEIADLRRCVEALNMVVADRREPVRAG